jgi:flagellar biosynthesis protein FliQ
MDFDGNIEQLRLAFRMIIMTAGPVLGVALAIGLLIGVLQAATSINEQTISFVPKLVVVLITLGLLSGYILTSMTDYFAFIFTNVTLGSLQLWRTAWHWNARDYGSYAAIFYSEPANWCLSFSRAIFWFTDGAFAHSHCFYNGADLVYIPTGSLPRS